MGGLRVRGAVWPDLEADHPTPGPSDPRNPDWGFHPLLLRYLEVVRSAAPAADVARGAECGHSPGLRAVDNSVVNTLCARDSIHKVQARKFLRRLGAPHFSCSLSLTLALRVHAPRAGSTSQRINLPLLRVVWNQASPMPSVPATTAACTCIGAPRRLPPSQHQCHRLRM